MSKYTTQIRFICESYCGLDESVGYDSVNEIIDRAIPHVFSFSFPIYDESYRNVLCHKILKHYYTREISAETVGLWKLWLDARLNEIMPYYNQLYKSAMIEFNPMYDVDLTTQHTRTNEGTTGSSQSGSSNSGNMDAFSETPQGGLDNVENLSYLTTARKITNDASFNSNSNGSASDTETYIQTIVGKNGGASYSTRLEEFRRTFLNIDKMIIDELSDLFFNLW